MLSSTLPAHQKGEEGSTLAAQGNQARTDTMWTGLDFVPQWGRNRLKCQVNLQSRVCVGHNQQKKSANPGYVWDIISNNMLAAGHDPPFKSETLKP